jgi:hypothetical protein
MRRTPRFLPAAEYDWGSEGSWGFITSSLYPYPPHDMVVIEMRDDLYDGTIDDTGRIYIPGHSYPDEKAYDEFLRGTRSQNRRVPELAI